MFWKHSLPNTSFISPNCNSCPLISSCSYHFKASNNFTSVIIIKTKRFRNEESGYIFKECFKHSFVFYSFIYFWWGAVDVFLSPEDLLFIYLSISDIFFWFLWFAREIITLCNIFLFGLFLTKLFTLPNLTSENVLVGFNFHPTCQVAFFTEFLFFNSHLQIQNGQPFCFI